jgi:hypothetical protein
MLRDRKSQEALIYMGKTAFKYPLKASSVRGWVEFEGFKLGSIGGLFECGTIKNRRY